MGLTMRIGKFRHRVEIQQKVVSKSATGGETISRWETRFWAWADINPPKGREYFAQGQTQASVIIRVCIRYQPDISVEDRILYKTRILHIHSIINPDELNRELILMCTEEV